MIAERLVKNAGVQVTPPDDLSLPTGAEILIEALCYEGVDTIFDTRAEQFSTSTTNSGAHANASHTTLSGTSKALCTWPRVTRVRQDELEWSW